eukprot:COSAG05_NODE_493_length_9295_cov_27.013158_3_plen_91_part_00
MATVRGLFPQGMMVGTMETMTAVGEGDMIGEMRRRILRMTMTTRTFNLKMICLLLKTRRSWMTSTTKMSRVICIDQNYLILFTVITSETS